jgi:hypothetical protein
VIVVAVVAEIVGMVVTKSWCEAQIRKKQGEKREMLKAQIMNLGE